MGQPHHFIKHYLIVVLAQITHQELGKWYKRIIPLVKCSSYNSNTKESYFSVGLQGLAKGDVEKVVDIICSTFDRVAK